MNCMKVPDQSFKTAEYIGKALLLLALILMVFNGAAFAEPVWENGEYLIYTSADLEVMAGWVNNSAVSADVKYRLMEDIDLDGVDVPWLPIGAREDVSFKEIGRAHV